MLYPVLRALLFMLDAEKAHHVTLRGLDLIHRLGLDKRYGGVSAQPKTVMGLTFPNPVGLAAGLDKNGAHIDALAGLGFGFIEIGTVTPRPQPGNPRPRLFRIPEQQAIINRMGFNNAGLDSLIANVGRARYRGILGINIGKNFDTPIERAADDYLTCLKAVYPLASYVTVNISSPNTKDLRQLQQAHALEGLLAALKTEQTRLAGEYGKRVPLALKIAPDLEPEQIAEIARLLLQYNFEAVIATNTTVARDAVQDLPYGNEAGGLSGKPLLLRSTAVVQALYQHLHGRIPIIGAGGILSGEDARQKIDAGAALVQLYTGLIYRGPDLVNEVCRALRK